MCNISNLLNCCLEGFYFYICNFKTTQMNLQNIPQIKHTESGNFFLLAGPCAIEGEEMALRIAEKLVSVTDKLQIPYFFKGSFKKANRSRIDSFSGIGDEKALKILQKVSKEFGVPTVTDIHTNEDAAMAAEYVDVLQIPAFLVRQTDLVVAAAKTGKTVNLKKGQFMSPESMKHAVQKVLDCNNENIMVTDRGTMFGYQDMIETIAKAGIAVGVDGIFIETHFDPANAKSDGANMLHLDYFEGLMTKLVAIRKTVNQF